MSRNRRSISASVKAPRHFRPQLVELESRETPTVGFTLSGNALVAFDTTNPAAALPPVAITGVATGETLVGIDFRPQNGFLYALGTDGAGGVHLYNISYQTGVATAVGAPQILSDAAGTPITNLGTNFGFDFNPTVDRIRVVTDGGFDFRMNPNTGAIVDTNAGVTGSQGDGMINGQTTTVDGAAYTNSQQNATVTTLYTLDAVNNALYIQNPPNNGTQIGALPITLNGAVLDFTAASGFDIPAGINVAAANAAATGQGFAALTVGGVTSLYAIELSTGVATLIGPIGAGTSAIQGLAIQSSVTTTSLPAVTLSADGQNLLRFDTSTPATVVVVPVTGVTAGDALVAIDYRAATGQLFGLGFNSVAGTVQLYRLDPQPGAANVATAIGTPIAGVTGANFAFDFNPTVDRIRVLTDSGLNFRLNPNDGTLVGGAFDGAVNPATSVLSATAYTNSFGQGTGLPTTQYTLDATANTLAIQNPPNAGTQTLIIPVTLNGAALDFTAINGFDITSNVRTTASNQTVPSGFGLAVLTVGGVQSLYSINLVTGAATNLGSVQAGTTSLAGLAVGQSAVGSVSFTTTTASISEAGGMATITLTRAAGSIGAFSVQVTASGSGLAATSFANPTLVTFADGQLTATITVPIADDTVVNPGRSIILTLSNPTNGAVLAQNTTFTLAITDNDVAPVIPPVVPPVVRTVYSSGGGTNGTISIVTATGATITLTPYAGYTGPIVVAQGDINGDNVLDVITGVGFGAAPHIKVFDGVTGAEIRSFFAFQTTFLGGVSVGSGDVDGDGFDDIIVGAGPGAGPNVAVFSGQTGAQLRSFFAYDQGYTGGINVAGGFISGGLVSDIITGSKIGDHVKVFSGATSVTLQSFLAFGGFAGGVFVGSTTIGSSDFLIVGAGASAQPAVKLFNADSSLRQSFFAYGQGFTGGVRVAGNANGKIITGAGPGAGPNVKTFDATTLNLDSSTFAFASNVATGVFVG